MEAKVEQLLYYREELALEENLHNISQVFPTMYEYVVLINYTHVHFQLDDNRLGAFFMESPGSEDSSFVKNQIMKYVGWLRRNVQPTDSEVNMEFVDP